MAPEITKRVPYSGKAADIWALGVILYLLVTGSLPFQASNESELHRLIQQGKWNMEGEMSKKGKNLLKKLLHCNSSKRITAQGILSDPWFSDVMQIDANN